MPNALWEPIVGSSIDSLAGQRAGWAQFNRGVESENLQRQAQAEQTRNSWLARVQQIQQQQADQQAAAESAQQQAMEGARRFDAQQQIYAQNLGVDRERIAAENRRTATMETPEQKSVRVANEALAKSESKLNKDGVYYAQRYAQIDPLRRQSQEDASKYARAIEEIDAQLTGFQEKTAAKEELTPEEIAAKSLLAKQKAEIKPLFKAADQERARHNTAYDRLMNTLTTNGYDIDPQSNSIVHRDTKKTWSFRPQSGARFNVPQSAAPEAPELPAGPRFGAIGQGGPAPAEIPQQPNLPQARTQEEMDAYIAQANQAIRRGANPAAVKARLKAMGIQLRE